MAQAVRYDKVELESLLSLAKENAPKQASGQQGGAYVPAGQLKYDEPEGWKITPRYAVLMGSCKLGVQGECPAGKLGQLFFQGFLEVMLGNCNIDEVELKLTLPDGSVQTRKESLKTYPVNKRIFLKVGEEFFNMFDSGNIKLELNGTESEISKKGLVVYGLNIKQIFDPAANAFKAKA